MKPDPEHISCYVCTRPYEKLATTKTEQRELAKAEGWTVAVPEWQMQPGVTREQWKIDHPDRKRSKIDICPDCMMDLQRKAVNSIGSRLFEVPPGRGVN
jgi:hypothetical protein